MASIVGVPAGPLWMIGCGNMGGAMLRRWLAAGLDARTITVVTRTGAGVPDGVRSRDALPTDEMPQVVVLAVKPQQLDVVAPLLAPCAPPLLLSILAGVEEAALAARIPAAAIVRAMPNLPVAIGRGVVALTSRSASEEVRAVATAMATPLGWAEWIADEAMFDAVTALAGCGPAFLFRFVDALTAAGVSLGLAEAQARRLALATIAGSTQMAIDADTTPAILADRVASPGGSTREGLNVLDHENALVDLMRRTLAAAARRNAELAAAAR